VLPSRVLRSSSSPPCAVALSSVRGGDCCNCTAWRGGACCRGFGSGHAFLPRGVEGDGRWRPWQPACSCARAEASLCAHRPIFALLRRRRWSPRHRSDLCSGLRCLRERAFRDWCLESIPRERAFRGRKFLRVYMRVGAGGALSFACSAGGARLTRALAMCLGNVQHNIRV
jgi:hypothetical protein